MNARTTLVTVVGPGGRRDLSLPADAPIRELLPPLIDLAGESGNGDRHPDEWTLCLTAGDPLPRESSLAETGILDGSVLYLAPVQANGAPPPEPPAQTESDGLTPQQRTEAALPKRLSGPTRTGAVLKAMVSREPIPVADHMATPKEHAADGKPTPARLTVYSEPSFIERARIQWRKTDYVETLCDRITKPRLNKCATIAVVSPKGGVGKTTVTALLGMLLSLLRRDRVVAVDTNPDYGSLGRVLAPNNQTFVDDVLRRIQQPDLTLTELDALLGRTAHGLMVLPAPIEPERMAQLDEAAYTDLVGGLKRFVGMVVLDCGTGLQEPAARAAIKAADQVVLVTDDQPAAASLVAEAAPLLINSGRPVTLVVNKMPLKGSILDVNLLGRYIPEARGLIVIPRELDAAAQLAIGRFDWRDAPRSWQRACAELANVLIADWPRLGLSF